jgi:hypothetical protein
MITISGGFELYPLTVIDMRGENLESIAGNGSIFLRLVYP